MLSSQCKIVGSCFLLLSCLTEFQCITEGAVMLSPSPRAFVCNAGDRLEVICNSTEGSLRWRLTLMGMTNPIQDISLSSTTVAITRLMINSSMVVVSKTSERGVVPLISTLVISSVSDILNGTLNITCIDFGTEFMATTTVFITGSGYNSTSLLINWHVEDYGPDKVTVSLWWTQDNNNLLASYSVGILPMVGATMIMISNTRANLTLSYNTLYNVSVTANPCHQSNTTTLIYANCGDPLDQSSVVSSDYTNLSLEGSTVNFTCPPGFALIGPNMSTCMGNGEWEPDPRKVNCIGPTTSECGSGQECLTGSQSVCIDRSASLSCISDNQNVPSPGHGVIVGALIGSAAILTIIVTIPLVLLTIIKRGTGHGIWKGFFQRKRPGTVDHENDYNVDDPQNQIRENQPGPVYADIGPSSLSTKLPVTLELDDSRVDYAQINLGLLKKKVKHSESVMNRQPPRPGLISDTPSVDLDRLLIQLRSQVSSRWYQFGEAAGIGKDVLDGYAKNCPPGDRIVEMLDYWLGNYDAGKPTWRDVARILRVIDLGQLADDIESVYSTGRLPIEVNINETPNLVTKFESIPDHNQDIPPPIPPKTVKQANTVPVLMPEQLPSQLSFNDDVSSNIGPPRPPKP